MRIVPPGTVLALCLMYFTQVYGFNFYVTWLPTYLKTARGFTSFKRKRQSKHKIDRLRIRSQRAFAL